MSKSDATSNEDDAARRQIKAWATDLIDLNKRSRLLWFKHLRTGTLEFAQDAGDIWTRMQNGGWQVHIPSEQPGKARPPRQNSLVVAAHLSKDRKAVESSLNRLRLTSRSHFMDTGIHVLFLGLGFLQWSETSGPADIHSPLYLMPVDLTYERKRDIWTLKQSSYAEPVINPALSAALKQQYGITLATLESVTSDRYVDAIGVIKDNLQGKLRGRTSNWRIDANRSVMSVFQYHKHAMHHDLKINEDTIVAHDMIRLLVGDATAEVRDSYSFDPIQPERLDEVDPPEDLSCVLNADASQRQCIVAAREGRSFIMSGPPGTGKSQTIANCISQLLRDGKTVLFVSEKIAALDVVLKRLKTLDLDDFILALHSHRTNKKDVAKQLGEALDSSGVEALDSSGVPVVADSSSRKRLAELQQMLTDYAIAVNEVRQPFNRSFHDVVGELAGIDANVETENSTGAIPHVELDQEIESRLSPSLYQEVTAHTERLSEALSALRAKDCLWKVKCVEGSTPIGPDSCRSLTNSYVAALSDLRNICDNASSAIRLNEPLELHDVGWLVRLAKIVVRRPSMSPEWLASDDFAARCESAEKIADVVDTADKIATELSGLHNAWSEIDPSGYSRLMDDVADAKKLDPMPDGLIDMSLSQIRDLRRALRSAAARFEECATAASPLTEAFDLATEPSVEDVTRLIGLGRLAGYAVLPEPAWFRGDVLRRVKAAVSTLEPLAEKWQECSELLGDTFKPEALGLDSDGIAQRYAHMHKGLRKLGSRYRMDKQAVAAVTVMGHVTNSTISRLNSLARWQRVDRDLDTEAKHHADVLGDYWRGPERTNFGDVHFAVEIAEWAIKESGGTVSRDQIAQVLGSGPDFAPDAAVAADRAGIEVAQLRKCPLSGLQPAAFDDLLGRPISDAAEWCRSAADVIDHIESAYSKLVNDSGAPATLDKALSLMERRSEHNRLNVKRDKLISAMSDSLGTLSKSPDSEKLREAAAWVRQARECLAESPHIGAALPSEIAEAVMREQIVPEEIAQAVCLANSTRDDLLEVFEEKHADTLRPSLTESFDVALQKLALLERSVGEVPIWRQFVLSRRRLYELGLGDAVTFCEQIKAPETNIPKIISKSLLRNWVDGIANGDHRLRWNDAPDPNPDSIRSEFQRLDKELVNAGAADVIKACIKRRKSHNSNGSDVIRKEAKKKSKHLSVRNLMDRAGDTAQRLKPCFMMSPLSVSHFLPPDMRFDVVIFDEASQVTEADAVNCIYRGDQLIVAGDAKQLPPTNFFTKYANEHEDEDDEDQLDDFESILDRCKAQGLLELPLRWHYRSHHEDLISFSNYRFYNGALYTFPSANYDVKELGVQMFPVSGVYRRAAGNDNPVEAEKVVERLLHHQQHHPDWSVGVVAFSSYQQNAVYRELERRSRDSPELQRLLDSEDRLHGLFVKNLENVQGDERDIIILTVGYGPDENGKIAMNFGPLNRQQGWRRLNVAVTRARRRMEVVSSISADQIRSDNESVLHLRCYLDYAARGPIALVGDYSDSHGEPESTFETEVLGIVRQMGYEAVPQVGVAGYRIDIGVCHPTMHGSYMLGIECDGASYHSSKAARDRDRLRQTLLEERGWTIHRIWSTSWLYDQQGETQRLREVLRQRAETPGFPTGPEAH